MKHTRDNQLIKKALMMILILSLVFTIGCSGEEWTSEEPGDTLTDEQTKDMDRINEEEELTIGLTSFRTKDIYGTEWDQSIFQDYSLTMVNVWGTFCGPCIDEMPSLGELQNEYESKGVNIVGIVVDVQDDNLELIDEQISLAKEIAEGTGADYTHLIVTEEMIDSVLNQFDAIPASFFVDSDGNIVSEFYIGSREKADWAGIIESFLVNQ